MDSLAKLYADFAEEKILPTIDYAKLQRSYDTDLIYAKDVLSRLHNAMVNIYGGRTIQAGDGDNGFVLVPGVVAGKESRNVCIALFELDLSSSGEHWGTHFLCEHGVISQVGGDNPPDVVEEVTDRFAPYEYYYTAVIPCDIHNRFFQKPVGLAADLLSAADSKESVIAKIRAAKAQPQPERKPKTNHKSQEPEL